MWSAQTHKQTDAVATEFSTWVVDVCSFFRITMGLLSTSMINAQPTQHVSFVRFGVVWCSVWFVKLGIFFTTYSCFKHLHYVIPACLVMVSNKALRPKYVSNNNEIKYYYFICIITNNKTIRWLLFMGIEIKGSWILRSGIRAFVSKIKYLHLHVIEKNVNFPWLME